MLPEKFVAAPEATIEYPPVETIDSMWIKAIRILKAGIFVPQHSHPYDHGSYVARGAVRLWADGVLKGDFPEFSLIEIKAGVKHLFQALEDNTTVLCLHNVSRKEIVEILERHELVTET